MACPRTDDASSYQLIPDDTYDDEMSVLKGVDAVLVRVPSIDEGLGFYRNRLGMSLRWRTETMAAVRLGNSELVLTTMLDPETDILVDAGGKVLLPSEDIPVGKVAVVEDPFGNRLTLVDLSKGSYETDESGVVIGVTGL